MTNKLDNNAQTFTFFFIFGQNEDIFSLNKITIRTITFALLHSLAMNFPLGIYWGQVSIVLVGACIPWEEYQF